MRTLKQIVNRVKTLAQSHELINQVGYGTSEDLNTLVLAGLTYPFCFIEQKENFEISRLDKLSRFNFSIYFFDLQNIVNDSRENILDVESDLVSTATDMLALLQRDVDIDANQDWIVSQSTQLSAKEYLLKDLCIGVELPIQIGLRYAADYCQIPKGDVPQILEDMKIISVYKYRVVGDLETITLPLIKKEIMFLTKGNLPLLQVASSPTVDEFTYNELTGVFGFGVPVYDGTILQIINRSL